jgi:hypothetical protein
MAAKRYRERNCEFCGRLFWPKSPSVKTCSDACRSARRTAQKRKLVVERREELVGPANTPLTPEEELAHEELLERGGFDGVPLTAEDKVRLRMRSNLAKRTDVNVGMLHPLDLPFHGEPAARRSVSLPRTEPQEWVTT